MSQAYLYWWKIAEGKEAQFEAAWAEATRLIHRHCGSMGARLHRGPERSYWSYARWPSEAEREACFGRDWGESDCFERMKACIEEQRDELVGTVVDDYLSEDGVRRAAPTIETERLVLRALRFEDVESLVPAFSDDDNMRYWSRAPIESAAELRRYMRWNVEGQGVECFAICLRDHEHDALGWVVLRDTNPSELEVGFILRPDAQGRGLATEALRAIIDHVFGPRAARRLYGDVDPENAPSVRLFESLGFTREAHLRSNWKTHIGVRDSYIYGLLDSDPRP